MCIVIICGLIGGLVLIKDIQKFLSDFIVWTNDNFILGTAGLIIIFTVAIIMMFPAVIFSIFVGYLYNEVLND